jgi:hypothetical protein
MRSFYFFITLVSLVTFLALTSLEHPVGTPFHSAAELEALQNGRANVLDSGEYFLGSSNCKGCHGSDTLGIASVDLNGNDINLYDDWESTMMALSAKDPFWRAKVNHEILVNPGHSDALQTKCTSCHAPMGHFTAMFKGHATYTIADMLSDTLGLNGVACGGCHSIAKDSLGIPELEYSGKVHYDTSRVEYGPFENPLVGPMELYVGLIPTYSPHMSRSQVCAPCHTLLTDAVNLSGVPTGTQFVEQATFHEWLNSDFNSDQPCQSCHMPKVQDPIVIANNILNLPPRSPFNRHKFQGANTFMLGLMKQNKNALGIDVLDARFDSTMASTKALLQTATLDMSAAIDSINSDTLYVSIELTNKAGHKFPSGYPSRRAFVQFAVVEGGDTVFQSGMLRPDFEVAGQGAGVEPHYNVINREDQVQIYEMAMGDVNSNFTTVLERAFVNLKDNRLPPAGFTTSHYAYDTAKIVGDALTDADFNKVNGVQGSGKDKLHYHIPLHGASGNFEIAAAVYYQTLPPRFLQEMFSYNGQFIDSFKQMYQGADKQPVLIAHAELDTTYTVSGVGGAKLPAEVRVFPVPSRNGNVVVESNHGQKLSRIEVWDAAGRKVKDITLDGTRHSIPLQLPDAAGIYYLRIESGRNAWVKKVIRD